MRATMIPLFLLTAVTVACSSDTTGPSSSTSAAARAVRAEEPARRPITGSCEATIAAPIPVSPGVIRQVDTGTCTVSHLGQSALYSDKVINLVTGTQTIAPTFTAANGDVLYTEGAGTNAMVGPGRVRFMATVTVIGGTGRFANASGELEIEGEADLVARTSAMRLTGWVAY